MTSKVLLGKVRAKRTHDLEIEPGKFITFLRPADSDMPALLGKTLDGEPTFKIGFPEVCKFVIAWRGITEADLLGAEMAPNDPVDFDAELWAEVVGDRMDWLQKVRDAILDKVVSHIASRAQLEKN